MAREFDAAATRYVACPVALADLRSPVASDVSPAKVKARRVCGPIWEVDRFGKPAAGPAPMGDAASVTDATTHLDELGVDPEAIP